jgi:hypothetical protein
MYRFGVLSTGLEYLCTELECFLQVWYTFVQSWNAFYRVGMLSKGLELLCTGLEQLCTALEYFLQSLNAF